MLLHLYNKVYNEGAVVTDGGTICPCFDETMKKLYWFLDSLKAISQSSKWVWMLSHIDYDHYSMTAAMVSQGGWRRPGVVILPAAYSVKECREALAQLHFVSLLIASILKLPAAKRRAPIDLGGILASSRRLAVMQGDRLRAGDLTYHILWPPSPQSLGEGCRKMLNELEEVSKKLRGRCAKERGHEFCERVVNKAESEADILRKIVKPNIERKGEPLELDARELIRHGDHEIKQRAEEEATITPLNYKATLLEAATRYKDPQLLSFKRAMNAFSTAYSLELAGIPSEAILIAVNPIAPPRDGYWCGFYFMDCRIFLHPKPRSLNPTILLYLSDLEEDSLDHALDYYIGYHHTAGRGGPRPLIEVAPHHGNAYSSRLAAVKPVLIYIPRCDHHAPLSWARSYRYHYRLHHLKNPGTMVIYSGHTTGLEIVM
jgi:hypothetical protein